MKHKKSSFFWNDILRSSWFELGVLGLFVAIALLAPLIAPYDPNELDLSIRLQGFNLSHLLGTDALGRDVLSRLMFGARTSLLVTSLSICWGGAVGILLGLCSGYLGGWLDSIIMRFMEALLSIPNLLLAMGIGVALGQGMVTLITALGIAAIPGYTLMVRAQVKSIRSREYVWAEQVMGAKRAHIIFRHILPNCISPLIITTTSNLGSTILAEAGLSFLNLGVELPQAAWDNMVDEGFRYLLQAPTLSILPGLMILVVVFSCNQVGEALRKSTGVKGGAM